MEPDIPRTECGATISDEFGCKVTRRIEPEIYNDGRKESDYRFARQKQQRIVRLIVKSLF